jgi:hypothetical protein
LSATAVVEDLVLGLVDLAHDAAGARMNRRISEAAGQHLPWTASRPAPPAVAARGDRIRGQGFVFGQFRWFGTNS